MKYAIITGTSRGLGEALVRQLLDEKMTVFSISRNPNVALETYAQTSEGILHSFYTDLQHTEKLEALMAEIFSFIALTDVEGIYLINNAGIVAPIKPVEKAEHDVITANIQVNLVAPMLLSSTFVQHANAIETEKRIINISSGAGKNPYYGWGAYCTAKAGIDMFTRCLALEEQQKEYPTKVLSFAPGVIDTDMQAQIRSTNKDDFINLDRFLSLKEEGKLLSPDYVAKAIVTLLHTENFVNGSVIRIDEN